MHAITTVKLYNAKKEEERNMTFIHVKIIIKTFKHTLNEESGLKREKKVFSVLIIDRHTSYSA